MTKILFYTDIHAADQNPRSRTGSYKDDILNKLREIIAIANRHQVDFLVNGADTFDRKSPWRVSHRLVREMIEIMREWPYPKRHLTVIGTHDVPTGQLEKLPQQPLGVLQDAGVITVLHETVTLVAHDPEYQVVFHPVPASYDLDKDPANYAITTRGENPDDPIITIAHGMIMKPGHSFFSDYTDAHEITKRTKADIVLYGHPHTPDGVFRTDPEGIEYVRPTFVGPGSVSRRDASPYNRTRRPQVALLTLSNIIGGPPKVELIPLQSARPGEEVFADLIKDEADENEQTARIGSFVESLKTASLYEDSWSHEHLLGEIRSSQAEEPVKKMAEDVLTDLVG